MHPKYYPSNPEIICQALTQRRCQESPSLFDTFEKPCFWRLSDLALLYPNIFNIKSQISASQINNLNKSVIRTVPEFKNIIPEPIHVLNIKDTYTIHSDINDTVVTIKNGPNQQLTRVACEFLFRQFEGTETEQAYFLYPNKSFSEIKMAAQDILMERARNQIAESCNVLSGIINRADNANNFAFRDVWASIWKTLYCIDNMDDLRKQHNVKSSPIDYMKPNTLVYINKMLQEIIMKFCDAKHFSIDAIKYIATTKAQSARACFRAHRTTPEAQLLPQNSRSRIEKVRRDREKFLREYYPQSLIQR